MAPVRRVDDDLGHRPGDDVRRVEVGVADEHGVRVAEEQVPIEPLAAVAQVEGHVLAERPHTVLVGRGVAEGVDLGDLPGGQRGDRCDPPGVTVVPRRCRHTRHAVKPRPGSGRAPDEGTTRTRRDDPNPEV